MQSTYLIVLINFKNLHTMPYASLFGILVVRRYRRRFHIIKQIGTWPTQTNNFPRINIALKMLKIVTKVTVAKIATSRNNIFFFIQVWINFCSHNFNLRIPESGSNRKCHTSWILRSLNKLIKIYPEMLLFVKSIDPFGTGNDIQENYGNVTINYEWQ